MRFSAVRRNNNRKKKNSNQREYHPLSFFVMSEHDNLYSGRKTIFFNKSPNWCQHRTLNKTRTKNEGYYHNGVM